MNETQEIPWNRIAIEAAAIVASILLAFAIDAWWDERQERLEEQEVLSALIAEFQLNRAEAVEVIETHELGRQRVAALAQLTVAEVGVLRSVEAEEILVAMANPRTFGPIRGTIDSLIGAGRLSIIQDRELRKSLTSFINLSEDAEEDAAYLTEWAVVIWKALIRHGGPWRADNDELFGKEGFELGDFAFVPKITAEDLSRIRRDSELMGLILTNQLNAAHYISEIRHVAAKIDETLLLLKAQLH